MRGPASNPNEASLSRLPRELPPYSSTSSSSTSAGGPVRVEHGPLLPLPPTTTYPPSPKHPISQSSTLPVLPALPPVPPSRHVRMGSGGSYHMVLSRLSCVPQEVVDCPTKNLLFRGFGLFGVPRGRKYLHSVRNHRLLWVLDGSRARWSPKKG